MEVCDSIRICRHAECTEPARWLRCRHCCLLSVLAMKRDQPGDVNVTYAITVGEAERLPIEVLLDSLQPTARHRVLPGINQGNAPGFGVTTMVKNLVLMHIDRYVRRAHDIMTEILFNEVAFVAATYYKVINAMSGIDLHDMPQDRPGPYLDQWLRSNNSLFG